MSHYLFRLLSSNRKAMITRLSRSIHMGRIVPELDSNLAQRINDQTINLKHIPTRRKHGLLRLPARLELAATNKLKAFADSRFRSELNYLIDVQKGFKLPDDRNTLKVKRSDIKTELEIRDKIKNRPEYEADEFVLQEERFMADTTLSQLIQGILEDRRRDWHYYEYDEYSSNLYMAARLPPNYAALKTVTNEIRDLDPSFEPKSVLDFGSGVGTTIWAVEETWPNSVHEFMNVEISKEQQYLCEYLLKGGNEFGETQPNIFHRQYLPSSTAVKYDIVVAAFSMLELPNSHVRAQTIENLWQKTNDFLIIIERGNIGGFTIVNEARHFVLDLSGHDVTKKINHDLNTYPRNNFYTPKAHVFAPCAHDYACPRATMSNKLKRNICRFRSLYEPLDCGDRKAGFLSEDFSFVVLRKKPHPIYTDEQAVRWPRIVEKRKHSSKQITHKLCCPNGCLAEAVITRKKYGDAIYEVAKSCDWGDILPIKVKDTYVSKSSFIDEKMDDNKSHE